MTQSSGVSIRRVVLWAVGVSVLSSIGTCGACLVWLSSQPAGGVLAANQMPESALEHIKENGLLEPGEKLVVYYDATMNMDGSESTLLTSARVVYHNNGRTTAIRLEDIERVSTSNQPLIGDTIDIRSTEGELVRIVIPPLNDGAVFIRELEAARSRIESSPPSPARNAQGG